MLKISLAVLFLIAGVTSVDICDKKIHEVCRNENVPVMPPETAEDLKSFCDFAISHFQCRVNHEEKCGRNSVLKEEAMAYLETFQDVCNEDTLLYEAAVDNLKCYSELSKQRTFRNCSSQLESSIEKTIETLTEEGLLSPTDNVIEYHDTFYCVRMLREMACIATKLDEKCGTIAKDTFVEILLKFDSVPECGEKFHLLPVIIQMQKLEEEKASEVDEAFRKR